MAFSSNSFRLVALITLFASKLPIYFYNCMQSLFFPKLSDLINTNINECNKVMQQVDPQKQKTAHEILIQQQQFNQAKSTHEEQSRKGKHKSIIPLIDNKEEHKQPEYPHRQNHTFISENFETNSQISSNEEDTERCKVSTYAQMMQKQTMMNNTDCKH